MTEFTEFQPMKGIDEASMRNRGYGEVRYGPSEDLLMVAFYPRSVQDPHKSEKAGRPIFVKKDYVKIQHPGESLNVIDREASDIDKARFRRQWLQYQEGIEQIPDGTPMNLLFPHSPEICEMLRGYKIHNVEQLAKLTAHGIETLGIGAVDWVEKAKKYLVSAAKGVDHHQFEKAMKEKDAQIATMQRQLTEFAALLAQHTAARDNKPVGVQPYQPLPDLSKVDPQTSMINNTMEPTKPVENVMFTNDIGTPKRRGRPAGSKNKPKEADATH